MLIRIGRGAGPNARPRAVGDSPAATLGDDDPLPTSGAVVVSLKRFMAERDALLSRNFPLGLRLESGESPQGLSDDVHKFAVIVLHIPTFKDGRAFSTARLLRARLAYRGEIRISGHFLKDQIAFFARVGADSFETSPVISVADVEKALAEFSHVYQPSVDGQETIPELRAERRRP